jgi:hypothetical protein
MQLHPLRDAVRVVGAVILAVGAACEGRSEPVDPLDPELVRELSQAQGTGSGTAHELGFELQVSQEACDCPTLEVEGETVDVCTLAQFGSLQADLSQGSGVLAISSASTLFTGAIQADGSFVIGGILNLATAAGPLESIHRMDGQFSGDDSAEGWAGQRLLGEIASEDFDCRWTGSFVLTRG